MLDHLLEEELWPAVAAPSRRRPKFSLQRPEGHIAQYLIRGTGRQGFLRRRRRVLRRLRAKSSLIVLTSEILDAHEARKRAFERLFVFFGLPVLTVEVFFTFVVILRQHAGPVFGLHELLHVFPAGQVDQDVAGHTSPFGFSNNARLSHLFHHAAGSCITHAEAGFQQRDGSTVTFNQQPNRFVKLGVIQSLFQNVVRVGFVAFSNFIKPNQITFELRLCDIFKEACGVDNFFGGNKAPWPRTSLGPSLMSMSPLPSNTSAPLTSA